MKPMMATHYARLEGGGWTPISADSIDTALANGYEVSTAPSQPDVDELANFIRTIDGNQKLGAGALAEKICAWLAASPSQQRSQKDQIEIETLQHGIRQKDRRIAELEAARIAYASEFPANEEGEPDVGSIHQNIRKLKAQPSAEALVQAALEAASTECNRMMMFPGGRQGSYAHHGVDAAAAAIRALSAQQIIESCKEKS